MFGRKSKTLNDTQAAPYVERVGAKNRPTPKRRDQEAARKRPLVPTDRKAAAGASRREMAAGRARQRAAMLTGDEANLPARDKGPVRRYLRDAVDARWNMGEFLLPVMVLVLLLSVIGKNNRGVFLVFAVVYLAIVVAVIDVVLLSRRLRKRAAAKFGEAAVPRGAGMYIAMRSFQLRRTRLPRPMVKRGERPA